MSDLLRDVDDAMRVEKMQALWNEHKVALVTGIVALILGTSAHTAWNAWHASQKRQDTSALLSALEMPKPLPALEQLASEKGNAARGITAMTAAANAMTAKNYDAALDIYAQLISDRSAPAIFRDLAIVQSVNLRLDQNDKVTAPELLKEIEPVAGNEKSPWYGQGLMARAIVKAHKGKDVKGAIADLEKISATESLPSSLRERAQALIDIYKLEGQS